MRRLSVFFTLIFALLFCLSLAHAAPSSPKASGPFYLEDTLVPPGSTRKLELDSLPSHRTYEITCDLVNRNYQDPYPIIMDIFINCCTNIANYRYKLDALTTKFTITIKRESSMYNQYLAFLNYDDSDLVLVKNCVAHYKLEN